MVPRPLRKLSFSTNYPSSSRHTTDAGSCRTRNPRLPENGLEDHARTCYFGDLIGFAIVTLLRTASASLFLSVWAYLNTDRQYTNQRINTNRQIVAYRKEREKTLWIRTSNAESWARHATDSPAESICVFAWRPSPLRSWKILDGLMKRSRSSRSVKPSKYSIFPNRASQNNGCRQFIRLPGTCLVQMAFKSCGRSSTSILVIRDSKFDYFRQFIV